MTTPISNVAPFRQPFAQFFDIGGNSLASGKVYTFAAGTSTPKVSYTSGDQAVTNTNPIILDSEGKAYIYILPEMYKFVVYDQYDNLIQTIDNIDGTVAPIDVAVDLVQFEADLKAELASGDADKGSGLIGYRYPHVDAVDRRVNAKLNEWVSVLDFGADPTKTNTENKAALQAAIASVDAAGGGVIIVPHNIKYGYKRSNVSTHPDFTGITNDIIVEDYSKGSSYLLPSRDGAQKRIFLGTPNDTDGLHDGNTIWHRGKWHPSFAICNDANYAPVGDPSRTPGDNRRASLMFCTDGRPQWQIAQGTGQNGDLEEDVLCPFAINAYTKYAGVETGGTKVLIINKQYGSFGFNGNPTTGFNYDFMGVMDRGNLIRFHAPLTNSTSMFFTNATGTRFGITVADDTKVTFRQGNTNFMFIHTDNSMCGWRQRVSNKTTTYTASSEDNQSVLTNTGATGGFAINLPVATVGLSMEFFVGAAQSLIVNPNNTDYFRGVAAGKYKISSTVGSRLKVDCFIAGIWEFSETGTWTTEA